MIIPITLGFLCVACLLVVLGFHLDRITEELTEIKEILTKED